MLVEIVNPDKTIFSGEANLVQLPGLDGLFEVLNNHAPLIAGLKQGKVKVQTEGQSEQFFDINGGVAEVLNNKVLVLAN